LWIEKPDVQRGAVPRDEDAAFAEEGAEAQGDSEGIANELFGIIYQLTPAENCSSFKLRMVFTQVAIR
jgi:hypothetical protein